MSQITGTAGDDFLTGTADADQIDGLDGHDFIRGEGGNDLVEGRRGRDDIFGNGGNDTLNGGGGRDDIFGGEGNDQLNGGRANDELFGNRGNDQLNGNDGNDTLAGAGYVIGNTSLAFGGGEIDTLTGGSGADRFNLGIPERLLDDIRLPEGVFYTASGNSDYALITDFSVAEDTIGLLGSASDYVLVEQSFAGAGDSSTDTLIHQNNSGQAGELIGVVADVTGLALSSQTQFTFFS
ncbi:calcium-binding protein [Moorena sp. SIO3H5]|uniref:calcium-binding protein n=1 Tax=Moorena sp. SIO3H5 TaxID=2607834 RepID=UPI0013B68D61|nr:calcium-binding protein [Moorena sp. SIO3H5]NEO69102.1 calcium-binding protein [Moorena sp. SIO3H5]